ncbi:MAG: hypothetical protein COA40_02650 [Aequorivita sp.]|nr:MAG: hypothetical protein COA40_02650 [Aequorivita sp.]
MKEQQSKELDQLIAKVMQKSTLETPSFQFTDKVLTAINAEQKSVNIPYRPLIPKYIWAAIVVGIIGITGYLWFMIKPAPLNLSIPSFNFMDSFSLSNNIPAFTPSKITAYAILFFALMLCIQIPMLKQYFNNRETH